MAIRLDIDAELVRVALAIYDDRKAQRRRNMGSAHSDPLGNDYRIEIHRPAGLAAVVEVGGVYEGVKLAFIGDDLPDAPASAVQDVREEGR